jgi:alkylhydroperoxidase family enzyme
VFVVCIVVVPFFSSLAIIGSEKIPLSLLVIPVSSASRGRLFAASPSLSLVSCRWSHVAGLIAVAVAGLPLCRYCFATHAFVVDAIVTSKGR